jgi:hypothetical protein
MEAVDNCTLSTSSTYTEVSPLSTTNNDFFPFSDCRFYLRLFVIRIVILFIPCIRVVSGEMGGQYWLSVMLHFLFLFFLRCLDIS